VSATSGTVIVIATNVANSAAMTGATTAIAGTSMDAAATMTAEVAATETETATAAVATATSGAAIADRLRLVETSRGAPRSSRYPAR
jgi:hypothetical protein